MFNGEMLHKSTPLECTYIFDELCKSVSVNIQIRILVEVCVYSFNNVNVLFVNFENWFLSTILIIVTINFF